VTAFRSSEHKRQDQREPNHRHPLPTNPRRTAMSEGERRDPIDLSEFSDEELLLAHAYLLQRRADLDGWTQEEIPPLKVTQTHSWEWRPSNRGGQARRTTCITKVWELFTRIDAGPAPDAEWFNCTREQYEALLARGSDPDEDSEAAEDEQP
jgi:hypothetical protein